METGDKPEDVSSVRKTVRKTIDRFIAAVQGDKVKGAPNGSAKIHKTPVRIQRFEDPQILRDYSKRCHDKCEIWKSWWKRECEFEIVHN